MGECDMKEVEIKLIGRTLTAVLPVEIDHHTARDVRERIDKEMFLHRPDTLKLDFSYVQFMDSSGLALIIGRVGTAEAVGAIVKLFGMSERLVRLVRLAGIERMSGLTIV